MYICDECGETFEEPKTYCEDRGEFWGQPCREEISVSPCCEGDYSEAGTCELCGEYYNEETAKEYNLCCDDCAESLENKFKKILHENFTEYEIKVINSIYDGRDIE